MRLREQRRAQALPFLEIKRRPRSRESDQCFVGMQPIAARDFNVRCRHSEPPCCAAAPSALGARRSRLFLYHDHFRARWRSATRFPPSRRFETPRERKYASDAPLMPRTAPFSARLQTCARDITKSRRQKSMVRTGYIGDKSDREHG